MQASNQSLSHAPPSTWRCWTQAGYDASGASNLALAYGDGLSVRTDEAILAGWMTERDNLVSGSIGHRRWLLDPFLGAVSYGRVVGTTAGSFGRVDAAALRVFGSTAQKAPTGALPAYVAYPQGDYPARFWADGSILSFGVVADPTGGAANRQVDFSKATVAVREAGGADLAVVDQRSDNDGFGLPNSLQFLVQGLRHGVRYDVTVSGVSGQGTRSSYSYSFRIVD